MTENGLREKTEQNAADTPPAEESEELQTVFAQVEEDSAAVEENPAEIEENSDSIEDSCAPIEENADKGQTETVPEPPKKKRWVRIFWNVFLVAVIAAGIVSLFGIVNEIDADSGASFGEVFRGASPLFCVVLVLAVLGIMALDTAMFCIISKTVTGKVRFSSSLKTNFLGRYYDAVTPFSTGGQPMQIYYLSSKGIGGGNASAMVLIKYFASIFMWMAVGAALMIWGAAKGVLDGISGAKILKVTGWVGIGVNLIIPTFVILFLLLPRIMFKLTRGVVKLGKKLRIVKDEEKATVRAVKVVGDFRNSFKVMATTPLNLILLLLVCIAEAALTFAVPYFVMKALSCPVDGKLFEIMSLNAFATFGVSFIPTPGNSGVVEGMGALAFSSAAGVALAWSVLIWRFSVFYIYILVGIGITVRDIIKKNVMRKDRTGKRQ